MSEDNEFIISKMSSNQMRDVADWAAEAGWNPGISDAEIFYETDQNAFFAGTIKDELVASISAVSYDESFGFIGFFIVKPEFRHNGFGLKIARHAVKHLGDRNIGLDGVIERQKDYEGFGFKTAYRNIRFEGKISGERSEKTTDAKLVPLEKIISFDRNFFPADRSIFLKSWLNRKDHKSVCVFEDEKISGYGVIRKSHAGFRIGPLFATKANTADLIFKALAAEACGESVYIDMPEINKEAIGIAKNNGMKVVFETARMYSKGTPEIDISGIYGVTSFELG